MNDGVAGRRGRQPAYRARPQRLSKKPSAHDLKFAQCVYVIPAGPFVKIGVSNDTAVRWRALRCGNPFVEPVLYESVKMHLATIIEAAIHRALARYRVRESKEWFKCNRYFA